MNARAIYSAEPARGWRPWGALVPFLGIVFVAVATGGPGLVLEHFRLADAQGNPLGPIGLVTFLLFPFAALGLLIIAWTRLVERRPLTTIGLVPGRAARIFADGHLTALMMVCGVVAAMWAASGLDAGAIAPALRAPAALGSITVLLACFALQSSVEEIVFRGWMFSAIAAKLGVPIAIALTSVVFAFLHYEPHQDLLFTANVVLFSVFACCWALRTGNIWGVMGWHAGWNWLLAVGFELRVTGLDAHVPALLVKLVPHGPTYLTGGTEGPEGGIMCSLFLLGGIAFQTLRAKRKP